ncbi:hypothetical protein C8Q74DRAFT_1453057 [Fomes fomentarius]|nr:hypothetical protein C8Q74DRAFT_1453057 [Fomes fomentarius]
MTIACRAHCSPVDDISSSYHFPLSPIDTHFQLWRSSPSSCDIANPGPAILSETQDLRAKSTHHRQSQPYPSPPLTDAALASTVPLPEVPGEPPRHSFSSSDYRDFVDENMSHDVARYTVPLSPPPTALIGVKDLPQGEDFQEGEHQVESWKYGGDAAERGVSVPFFPPVRDDSGFEEFGTQEGHEEDHKFHGSHAGQSLIEPTSVWSPHSPLSMDEGLPDFPSLHDMLSIRSSGHHGHHDAPLSPVSPSDGESQSDDWASGSEMDWAYSPSPTYADISAPPSPKPGCLSLDLGECEPHWFTGDQPTPLPEDHSPFSSTFHHPLHFHPPSGDLDTDYPDTVMPSEDDDDNTVLPPASPRKRLLNDLYDPILPHGDAVLTPVPRSPHTSLFSLPDCDMEDPPEAPSSPHSPHRALPVLDDDGMSPPLTEQCALPMETISPSLLGGAPEQQPGLGLFLQPISDLPLARSPSPSEDDFGFLDVQLDPESANVEIDEFLALRALRKHALAQERAARMTEADLNERITAAASVLLPPSHAEGGSDTDSDGDDVHMHCDMDIMEKRARKRDLHVLMDMRAEARRTRKLQKQRSKEIGALLDFKMHGPMSPMEGLPPLVGGKGWTRSIAHLVAHMVFRRRDRSRPLEGRAPAGSPAESRCPRRNSGLRMSVSAEDLLLSMSTASGREDADEDEDDDMEM